MTSVIRPTVLIIDPDALTLMGLSATLHHHGHEVHGARTAAAALKAAESLNLDLVLIDDLVAPDGGREILQQLRALPHLSDLPAVWLMEPHREPGRLPLSTFCQTKPVDIPAMMNIIKRALWLPHLVHQPETLRAPQGVFRGSRRSTERDASLASEGSGSE